MPVRIAADLTCIPRALLPRVLKALDQLDKWPNVSGVKPLRGDLFGHYRKRVGDLRIIFRVEGTTVIVVRVSDRKDAYDD